MGYNIDFSDTICAIATPPGIGGISVIRVSGNQSIHIVDKIFKSYHYKRTLIDNPRSALFGHIYHEDQIIDDVVCTYFMTPQSFTGEDVIEISCHGSVYIQNEILNLLINNGCRMATNGEFSHRAFINGKLDLSQAESIADLIACESKAQHQMAINQLRGNYSSELNNLRNKMIKFASLVELELDFSEEDVEFADRIALKELLIEIKTKIYNLTKTFKLGNAIKKGIPIAIAGVTNVGKSSILNSLIGENKAIVSDIHGTTRDSIEDVINIGGSLFRFVDTAGLRDTNDIVENLGIDKSYQMIERAYVVLIVIDITSINVENGNKTYLKLLNVCKDKRTIIVFNKCDKVDNYKKIAEHFIVSLCLDKPYVCISAKENIGMDILKDGIFSICDLNSNNGADMVVSNIRHYELLSKALSSITSIEDNLYNITTDLLAQEMRYCISYIGEITGKEITSDNILHNIFSHFCIGK